MKKDLWEARKLESANKANSKVDKYFLTQSTGLTQYKISWKRANISPCDSFMQPDLSGGVKWGGILQLSVIGDEQLRREE